jgi:hypothetical protein
MKKIFSINGFQRLPSISDLMCLDRGLLHKVGTPPAAAVENDKKGAEKKEGGAKSADVAAKKTVDAAAAATAKDVKATVPEASGDGIPFCKNAPTYQPPKALEYWSIPPAPDKKALWTTVGTAAAVFSPPVVIPTLAAAGITKIAYDQARKFWPVSMIDRGARTVLGRTIGTLTWPFRAVAASGVNAVKSSFRGIHQFGIGIKDTLGDFREAIVQKVGLKDKEGNPIGLPGLALYGMKRAVVETAAAPFRLLDKAAHLVHDHPGKAALIGLGLYGAHMTIGIPEFAGKLVMSFTKILTGIADKIGNAATTVPEAIPGLL